MNMTNRSPKAKLVVATQDTRRPTAHEILEGVSKNARDELARPTPPVDDPPDNPTDAEYTGARARPASA